MLSSVWVSMTTISFYSSRDHLRHLLGMSSVSRYSSVAKLCPTRRRLNILAQAEELRQLKLNEIAKAEEPGPVERESYMARLEQALTAETAGRIALEGGGLEIVEAKLRVAYKQRPLARDEILRGSV